MKYGRDTHLFADGDSSELVPGKSKFGPRQLTPTNNEGYYCQKELAPGFYLIAADIPTRNASVSGQATPIGEVVEVFEGKTTVFDIALCEGGSIGGMLLGKEMDPGIAGFQLHLRPANAPPIRLDESGRPVLGVPSIRRAGSSIGFRYSFEDVCPGNYTLTAFRIIESPGGKILEQVSLAVTIKRYSETELNIQF